MMNPHFNPYQELHHSPHSPVDGFHPSHQTILNSNGHIPPPQGPNDPQRLPLNGESGGSPVYSNNGGGICGIQHGGGVKVCAACGGKILERYLLHALDRYWHHTCLKCSCCGQLLAEMGSSCFTKAGMILCKADYIRLFGNSGACASCGQTIPASEFVMRAGPSSPHPAHPHQPPGHFVYHVKCFTCSKCQTPLMPGDRYALVHGALFCEQDCQKLLKGGPGGPGVGGAQTGTARKGKVGRPRRSRD